MSSQLSKLTDTELRTLAAALRSGRLAPPLTTVALQRFVSSQAAYATAQEIESLLLRGLTPQQFATALELVVEDRRDRSIPGGLVDLVTTGPETVGANRDTAVVVREMFANATESVLVAGFAVYQGQRVFQALADRMQQVPNLQVTMFLDVQRPQGDSSLTTEVVRRFAERFHRQQWPGDRPIPTVYFDPRSLNQSQHERACLHAKCVVVDSLKSFVSSANFTEAAQLRNVEVGVLIESQAIARQIAAFFKDLIDQRQLVPINGH